jgi:hypothetical protein
VIFKFSWGGGAAGQYSLPPFIRAQQFSTHIIIIIISVLLLLLLLLLLLHITFYTGHFATSRKVAGSIPVGVIEIFIGIILPAAQ